MHLSLRYVAVIVVGSAFLVSACVAFFLAAYRSLSLPVCSHCGAKEVHRSASHRAVDMLVRCVSLVPYRCWVCQRRFYGFRNSNALPQTQI
jgi:hypothetical protein